MSRDEKILIADDDPEIVKGLALRCRKLGLEVDTASNGLQAILKATRNPPRMLILDLKMPEADGFKVCEWLLSPRRPPMDVILLTGESDDEILVRCDSLGAFYVPKSTETWDTIKTILCETLKLDPGPSAADQGGTRWVKATEAAPAKILIVDDDPDLLRALEHVLKKCGAETTRATNGIEGYRLAVRDRPDVIIADYVMPEAGGHYLLWRLRSTEETRDIPVIVITGNVGDEAVAFSAEREIGGRSAALKLFRKPLDTPALVREIAQHCKLRSNGAGVAGNA